MNEDDALFSACPLPIADYPRVLMAHGGGGRLMHQLLERMILPAFVQGTGRRTMPPSSTWVARGSPSRPTPTW